MAEPIRNISGDWIGYYVDENNTRDGDVGESDRHVFPISIHFHQKGDRIEGRTRDDEPTSRTSLRESLAEYGATWGRAEVESARDLLRAHPNAAFESRLPTHGVLVGRVAGCRVTFTKRYIGAGESYLHLGDDRRPIEREEQHAIRYAGTLDASGNVLEGTWVIPATGWFACCRKPNNSGTFRVMRGEAVRGGTGDDGDGAR